MLGEDNISLAIETSEDAPNVILPVTDIDIVAHRSDDLRATKFGMFHELLKNRHALPAYFDKQERVVREVDVENAVVKFAHVAKRNGISRVVLLSSYGALSQSNVSYLRIKGQLEEQIASLAFDQYIIFRPGILLRKDTDRFVERATAGLLHLVNGLGMLRKYRPMPTSTLATKMAKAPGVLADGTYTIELDEILEF